MWLLEAKVKRAMEEAERNGKIPTLEERTEINASVLTAATLELSGNMATIDVSGVLTQEPNFMAVLFGGGNTTYSSILSAISEVERSPQITQVDFAIASPGGEVDGLFEVLSAISAMKTPTSATVSTLAASAAYMIASQADTIVASNPTARFGSIGVRADFEVSDDYVTVTSSNAPNKAPDVTTEEGKSQVQSELDALEDIFIEAVADGRGVKKATVIEDFGKGGMFLAAQALDKGMIDSLSTNNSMEIRAMNSQELKTQHPDVYASVLLEGQEAERDRVSAHLKLGEASGDMKTAIGAIEDGSGMTATLTATYMSAGMNRRDLEIREEDDIALDVEAKEKEESEKSDEAFMTMFKAKLEGGDING